MAIAIVVGCGVVFHFLGVAWFPRSTWQFHSQNVLVYALIFVVATMGVFVQPKVAKPVVIALSLPTVLFSFLMLLGLLTDGRGWSWVTRGWSWVVLILEVIGIASVGAAVGYVARRKGTAPSSIK